MQEAARKDVERAFGVLQSRFAILKNPARMWKVDVLHDIIVSCIILHNMIVEDERDEDLEALEEEVPPVAVGGGRGGETERVAAFPLSTNEEFIAFLERDAQLTNTHNHQRLRDDLVEHLWRLKGSLSH